MPSPPLILRRRMMMLALLVLSAAAVSLGTPAVSHACGGLFCSNPPSPDVPPVPIYQAGERVVFAFDEDRNRVTMHLEIAYTGDAENFAWILPIPALPTGEGDLPLPLEQVLDVSTVALFDQLQAATDPKFDVDWRIQSSCGANLLTSLDTTNSATDGDKPLDDRDGEHEVFVRVRDRASVGPYEAELVEANDTDALYEWLSDKGYFQDPKASAILSDYVKQDFQFLALRLRKGVEPGEIRPISLEIAMTNACVPLRLTQIAAVEEMPILVWVLGEHRAIPKNFLHARVNPRALQWPEAPNYVKTVSRAINEAAGRAFVTEYAAPDRIMEETLFNADYQNFEAAIQGANDVATAVGWIMPYQPVRDADLRRVMRAHIEMPEGTRGYPMGNCLQVWTDQGERGSQPACEPNDSHQTTELEFYGYIDFWMTQTSVEVDLGGLKARMETDYFAPRRDAQALLDRTAWITRFFTTISAPDMTRDPVFAFNEELGRVEHWKSTRARAVSDQLCRDWELQVTYPDGSKNIVQCADSSCEDQTIIQPIAGEPALYQLEVIDEWGNPQPFDPATASEVDEEIGDAEAGSPSLSPDYELTPPPERPNTSHLFGASGFGGGSGGLLCSAQQTRSSSPTPGWLLAAGALMGMVALRRRRR